MSGWWVIVMIVILAVLGNLTTPKTETGDEND